MPRITTDPGERAGVYKYIDDVPDRYRLYQHASAYEGRNVWEEYLNEYFFENFGADSTRDYTRRAGNDWKDHTADRGRHHALATPEDVEVWCTALLKRMQVGSAYRNYWTKLERFYSWLHTHTEHPHVYHPFRMAAAEYSSAGAIWERKIDSWEGRDE
jgi:hypothetical protein